MGETEALSSTSHAEMSSTDTVEPSRENIAQAGMSSALF
jgi:hypothetical protein